MRHVAIAILFASACTDEVEEPVVEVETTGEELTTSGLVSSSSSSTSTSTSTSTTSTSDDPSSSSSSEDTGGFVGRPDVGTSLPPGVCLGMTPIGWLGTVQSREGATIDPTCSPTATGCGGDLVGTWTLESNCGLEAIPNFFENDCPGSTMTFLGSEFTGTRTFNDDLTFSVDGTLVFDVQIDLDTVACFGVDCETFGGLVDAQEDGVDVACSETELACSCIFTITDVDDEEGTYEIDGDQVVFTIDGEELDPVPFCATGDRLELWHALHESQLYPDTHCKTATDCEDALGDAYEEWECI